MGVLSMFGLMRVEDYSEAAGIITRQAGTIATLQHNADLDRAAIKKQAAKIAELTGEVAAFRAKRERDNAGRRERHARKSETVVEIVTPEGSEIIAPPKRAKVKKAVR